jgi:hypothetical protein
MRWTKTDALICMANCMLYEHTLFQTDDIRALWYTYLIKVEHSLVVWPDFARQTSTNKEETA